MFTKTITVGGWDAEKGKLFVLSEICSILREWRERRKAGKSRVGGEFRYQIVTRHTLVVWRQLLIYQSFALFCILKNNSKEVNFNLKNLEL